MPGEVGDSRDAVVTEVKKVEMEGRLLDVEDCGQLVVGGLDRGQEFESIEVPEGIEAVERKVYPL